MVMEWEHWYYPCGHGHSAEFESHSSSGHSARVRVEKEDPPVPDRTSDHDSDLEEEVPDGKVSGSILCKVTKQKHKNLARA